MAPRTNEPGKKRYFTVSWEELHRSAQALAWRLDELGKWKTIVAVARGGLVPAAIVARELDIRTIETICVSSYVGEKQGTAQLHKSIGGTGRGMLIIDDLVDTGATAKLVKKLLPEAHVAALFAKPAGIPYVHTFISEVSQDTWIVFPWDTTPGS